MKLLHIENKLAELFRMKSRRRTAAIKRPKQQENAKQEAMEACREGGRSRPPTSDFDQQAKVGVRGRPPSL